MDELYRGYKDLVFRKLFGTDADASKNSLSLYKALTGDTKATLDDIKFVHLDNTFTNGVYNDVAFTVNGQAIVLAEHQSTDNENMPARMLIYLGRELEQILPSKDRFKRKLVRIPKPLLYVFYNGRDENFPLEKELRFSDSYVFDDDKEITVEAKVKVININYYKSHKILETCPLLGEYAEAMQIVRLALDAKLPVDVAVKICLYKGVLVDFIKRHETEVFNMFTSEYDYALDRQTLKEEAYEDGRVAGLKKGREEGRASGLAEGHASGFEDGQKQKSIEMAQKLLAKGWDKQEIEDTVNYTFDELNLNNDGTLKNP